jgi:type IV pilus assembly protein PilC
VSAALETPAITSVSKAARYLCELAPSAGYEEALRRIAELCDAPTAEALERLRAYAAGASNDAVAPELALVAELLRRSPDKARAGAGAAILEEAAAEARSLAAEVRFGMPRDFYYSAVLLVVAALLATLWLFTIAPQFGELFDEMGGRVPAFTGALVEAPWALFGVIAALGVVLFVLIAGMKRLAAALETARPLQGRLARAALGLRVQREYERWRTAVLASALMAAGQDPKSALGAALGPGADEALRRSLSAELALAERLGLARAEAECLREASLADLAVMIERRRSLAARLMHAAVALVVGAIVIAIYLPLFEMGAVI